MKVVILAGGLGTRINETGHLNPKPMTEVGDKPIIWHIMKLYSFSYSTSYKIYYAFLLIEFNYFYFF